MLLLQVLLSASAMLSTVLHWVESAAVLDGKVLLMKDNGKSAAGELWQALNVQLWAFIRSRVRTDADADDLLQDVFTQVVEKVASVRKPDRIQSWVFQIARNAIVDSYRRRIYQGDNTAEQIAALPTNWNDGNLNSEIATWLSSMIAKLPATLQDAARMYELEGHPQLEVAKRLGISLSGAKSRIQRARRELSKMLQTNCQLELDRRGNVIACAPNNAEGCAQASCHCLTD